MIEETTPAPAAAESADGITAKNSLRVTTVASAIIGVITLLVGLVQYTHPAVNVLTGIGVPSAGSVVAVTVGGVLLGVGILGGMLLMAVYAIIAELGDR